MSELEFLFSLELSDENRFDDMVNQLAAGLLAWAGCAEHAGALTSAVREVLSTAHGQRHCVVSFHARGGKLRLTVTSSGHPRWETDVALPKS